MSKKNLGPAKRSSNPKRRRTGRGTPHPPKTNISGLVDFVPGIGTVSVHRPFGYDSIVSDMGSTFRKKGR
jgi:hypothetical protein